MKSSNILAVAIATCLSSVNVQASDSPAAGDSATTLDAVNVQGKFLNTAAKSATKMDIDVMDTPFSVQSYSEDFIDSIEASNLSELFNYMTGVKKAGITGMDISFRGFKSSGDDSNSILVDGLPGMAGRFGSPPSVALDQVELVRGSMSVLYGQNQPGGFINLITKKPEYERSSSFGVRATTYAGGGLSVNERTGYSVDFDTTGHVDEEGALLYRFVGEHGDRDTFRDYGFEKSTYLAPSVTWNVGGAGSATQVTLAYEHRDSRSSFDQGLVAPDRDASLIAPITTFYGEPGVFREEKGNTLSAYISHAFDNGWAWNTSLRTVDYESEQQEFSHVGIRNDGRTLNRRARHLNTERGYDSYDTNLTMEFGTESSINHKVVVGLSGGEQTTRETRLKFFNSTCPGTYCFDIDIYNPIYGQVPNYSDIPANNPATPNTLTDNGSISRNSALYFSDVISFGDHWKVALGGRTFTEKQELVDHRDPAAEKVRKKSRKSLLPMAGLLFQPNDNWTIYTSYSESYVPADPEDMDINGENHFQPLSGEQIEVGAKAEGLLNGRLGASLAVFRIDQLNVLNSFPCIYGVCYDQMGEARSEGVELEANFVANENWQIKFGYAYTDARVVSSNVPVQTGAKMANAPEHTANIWSHYQFGSGISLGTGVAYIGRYEGVIPALSTPKLMPMPGYTVVDIALGYKLEQHGFNLKIGNVFDKRHYEATGLTGQIQIMPGAPRNMTFSYRYSF